jgi:hypothetical protein
MGNEDVRGTPEAVDEAWLTDALADAGVANGAKVTGVEFLGYIGTGQTGRNGRFRLTWDQPDGRPATVVAKFPSDDPPARASAFGNGTYLREWNFYTSVVDTVSIRAPKVWAARYDEATPDFVLLMEDIAGSVQGDQLAGLTPDQAALAASAAVGLHAPRWGEENLAEALGMAIAPEMAAMVYSSMYGMTMEGTIGRLGHRLDDDVIDLIRAFASKVGPWIIGLGAPATVVHMDYRPDNFLFGVEEGAPPLVVVDWQTFSAGPAMNDLAYMIGGGFEPAQRAEVERDLVESWRTQLVATGIDYDADTCWRDYRVASLWGVGMTVMATMLAEETERGNDMLTAMAQRHGRHAIDLDAISLLP